MKKIKNLDHIITEIKNDFFKDENDKNSNSLILIDDINNEK